MAKNTKYTKTNLAEKDLNVQIDIEKLLGKAAQNEVVRETFFQLAFDSLMARLDAGESVNGKAMKSYSKAYKDSLAFEVFSKDGTVNMQLTGDMVNDISIQKQSSKLMTIGFNDELQSQKAYAHMTGFAGHPHLDGKVKPREWFGWSDKELEAIAQDLRPELEEKELVNDEKILNLLERFVG